jgi:hypothetical protein
VVRFVLLLVSVGVVIAFATSRMGDLTGPEARIGPPPVPPGTNVPEQFRELLATNINPGEVIAARGGLPGFSTVRRLVTRDDGGAANSGPRPFADLGPARQVRAVKADVKRNLAALNGVTRRYQPAPAAVVRMLATVYSAAMLERLGEDGRRELAAGVAGAAAARGQVVRVVQFDGVFVSDRRALAQVMYRRFVRQPSGAYLAGSTGSWQVLLSFDRGRWRFERGLEARAG